MYGTKIRKRLSQHSHVLEDAFIPCPYCPKTFQTKDLQRIHLKQKHGKKQTLETVYNKPAYPSIIGVNDMIVIWKSDPNLLVTHPYTANCTFITKGEVVKTDLDGHGVDRYIPGSRFITINKLKTDPEPISEIIEPLLKRGIESASLERLSYYDQVFINGKSERIKLTFERKHESEKAWVGRCPNHNITPRPFEELISFQKQVKKELKDSPSVSKSVLLLTGISPFTAELLTNYNIMKKLCRTKLYRIGTKLPGEYRIDDIKLFY